MFELARDKGFPELKAHDFRIDEGEAAWSKVCVWTNAHVWPYITYELERLGDVNESVPDDYEQA